MTIINGRRAKYLAAILYMTTTLLLISACTVKQNGVLTQQATLDLQQTLSKEPVSYEKEVRPVLQRRCVVCHGCYDAPCQLKLSSPAGIARGASKIKVYEGSRFSAIPPTRLYIDAKSTEEWREKGFHTVLNEGPASPLHNLEQSVMYKMLSLKKINPQPDTGKLSDSIDLSLSRKQTCPTLDEFSRYEKKFPDQGMPFAMPNLKDEEYRILVQWLAQGAPVPEAKKPSPAAAKQIKRWETFLNGSGNKQMLVSRYIYEHLFIGHMHFEGTDEREFYRLVRSTTPPGEPVDEIATVRPYDDPGTNFYYRLQRFPGDIVAKTHLVYELSDQRMARYKALFLEPDYDVAELPSWDPLVAANPFKAYKDIPPRSRYEFLLDEARYFIEGFIKGPVCRGMVALSVIEDQFWVAFIDPKLDQMLDSPDFLEENADYLQIPSVQGSNIGLFSAWKQYRDLERQYTAERFKHFQTLQQHDIKEAVNFLWNGGGTNPNAALTIFRHFDSASIEFGFKGNFPDTAWVIDYPLLERIHYLLVAGYNVFDNMKHQLNTRLYMDFLRMEGEDMYLAFMPSTHRKAIHDSWYTGMRDDMQGNIGETDLWMTLDVVTGYKSDDPQREFFQHVEKYFGDVIVRNDVINRCGKPPCYSKGANADKRKVDSAMRQIAGVKGVTLAAFPDIAFVRVKRNGKPENDFAYTFIRNKAYKNVTSMFQDEEDSLTRDYSHDSMTVVDSLVGAYPSFFFSVDIDDIEVFTNRYAGLQNAEEYEKFVSEYGTRRTNANFWETADWFQDESLREKPIQAGLFDLNRYQNR
jgi:hypothetical protein